MYKDFYGFEDEPFRLTPDPNYFYCSPLHEEAIRVIEYGISSRKGFMMLTGEVGTGKTTLCRVLLDNLVSVETALVLNPLLSSSEILRSIVRDFNIPFDSTSGDGSLYNVLVHYFTDLYRKDKNALIVVDESQNLSFESLEMIRQISNIEMENAKLVQILLVGQPELVVKLSDHRYRQLRQRISLKAVLDHLDHSETENYVNFRLQQALKYNKFIFEKDALKQLHKESQGIPRQINQLADLSLLISSARSRKKVKLSDVILASNEFHNEPSKEKEKRKITMPIILGALLACMLLCGVLFSNIFSINFKINANLPVVVENTKPEIQAPKAEVSEVLDKPVEKSPEIVDEPAPKVNLPVENVVEKQKKCIKLKANLNFRSEPLIIKNIIEVLPVQSEYMVVNSNKEWIQIKSGDTIGWITRDPRYVKDVKCGDG